MSCLTSWSAILIFAFSKRGRTKRTERVIAETESLLRNSKSVGVQLAIFIFVVDHAERIIPGLQVFENYCDILTCRFNNPFFDWLFQVSRPQW